MNLFPYIKVVHGPEGSMQSGQPSARLGYHLPHPDGDDGLFAEWDWDGRRLEARVDWLGVHPLFYGFRDGELVVSNNILRILEQGIPADFDLPALSVFFRLGFFVDCDTPFRYIRAFPPGGVLSFEDGKLEVAGSYPQAGLKPVSEKEESEAYIELFRSSVSRRKVLHGDFIQPVSGGRDSRHIVAELVRQGVRPEFTYTIETLGSGSDKGEEAVAAALSERLGLPHRVLRHPVRSEIRREALKNLFTSFACNEGNWMLGALDALTGTPEAIYDGFLGDVLSAYHWPTAPGFLDALSSRATQGIVDAVLGRFMRVRWDIDEHLRRRFGDSPELSLETCRERMGRFFDIFADTHNPITRFFIFSRGRREIAMSTWGMYPFVGKILAPYLDRDFFLFYLRQPDRQELPYAWRRSEAIARAYPEIADVPYAMPSLVGRRELMLRKLRLIPDVFLADHAGAGCPSGSVRSWFFRRAGSAEGGSLDINSFVYLQQLERLAATGPQKMLGQTEFIMRKFGAGV